MSLLFDVKNTKNKLVVLLPLRKHAENREENVCVAGCDQIVLVSLCD